MNTQTDTAAGAALARFQREHGMTNRELSTKLDVSMKSLAAWKKGIRHPRRKQREAIKSVTGLEWESPPTDIKVQDKPKVQRRPRATQPEANTGANGPTTASPAPEREVAAPAPVASVDIDAVTLWKLTQQDLDVTDEASLRLVQSYARRKATEELVNEIVDASKQGPVAVLEFMARTGDLPAEIVTAAKVRLSA